MDLATVKEAPALALHPRGAGDYDLAVLLDPCLPGQASSRTKSDSLGVWGLQLLYKESSARCSSLPHEVVAAQHVRKLRGQLVDL